MEPPNRHDPRTYGSPPSDWAQIEKMGMSVLRLTAGVVGIALILVGLCLALSVFGLIRGIIEDPGELTPHLDAWESALRPAPAPDAPEPPPEQPDAPVEQPAGPLESAPTEEESAPADPDPGLPAPHRTTVSDGEFWLDLLDRLVQAVHEGNIARPVGALFILLFAVLLAKIPLSMILAGVRVVAPLFPQTGAKKKTSTKTSQ